MEYVDSKVFRSGNSEAVRIPKSMAYGSDIDVTISRVGETLWIRPKERHASLAEMGAKLLAMGPVGELEQREPFDFPERIGL